MKKIFAKCALLAGLCWGSLMAQDVLVWEHSPEKGSTVDNIAQQMKDIKEKGVTAIFYHSNFHKKDIIAIAAREAKKVGLEFHTWIPTLVQDKNPDIPDHWYAVSREGFSSKDKPAFVPYYTFLCPNNEELYRYLSKQYVEVAKMENVDGVHLDYIRFPDVILARGLWAKYDLVMNEEMAPYDYCYCDRCVSKFKKETGVDIKALGDDARDLESWKQFRYDSITKLVNRLAADVHAVGKKISAAVFPGPSLSRSMVRQDWGKWNLDMVAPMIYNDFYLEKPEWVGPMVKEGIAAKNPKTEFIAGLFVCPDANFKTESKDPENYGLTPEELKIALMASSENGAKAVSFFTANRMTPAHWKVVAEWKKQQEKDKK